MLCFAEGSLELPEGSLEVPMPTWRQGCVCVVFKTENEIKMGHRAGYVWQPPYFKYLLYNLTMASNFSTLRCLLAEEEEEEEEDTMRFPTGPSLLAPGCE